MINGIEIIALIPARGGSKSVPRKNLQPLGDKPLIAWAIKAAKESPEIDRIIVSTDDDEIEAVAILYGAEVYRRPAHLATDSSLVVDTVRNLVEVLESEGESIGIFILLEPTCPIRPEGLVSKCLHKLVESECDSLATFSELTLSPERVWKIENELASPFFEGSNPWRPRQFLQVGYELNGAIYAFYPKSLPDLFPSLLFGKSYALIMEERIIDIDTFDDLEDANAILSE